jgi:hypothetical protein
MRGAKRQDVAIIVGRPSRTIESKETAEEKEQMEAWRGAAHGLAPVVLEGLTVDKAFAGLKTLKAPIGKLYIIGHADASGVGEISDTGDSVSRTVENLTQRMKKAQGELGDRRPESVEMLSCFGGGSPQTMGKIGEAVGAPTVRAPVQQTVISARIIRLNEKRLTAKQARQTSDEDLNSYIQSTDALKNYDYVPGVPHPDTRPSETEKLSALRELLRRTGVISYVSYNAEAGKRDALPYWKAPVQKKKRTDELSVDEDLTSKGVIEVDVDVKRPVKTP